MNTNMNSNGFKYCTNCRTRLPRQAVFCYKCSARQAMPQTPPPMNGRPMPNPGARPNPNPNPAPNQGVRPNPAPNPAPNPPPKPEFRKENPNPVPPKYENVQDVTFREAPQPQPMPAPQPQQSENVPPEKNGMNGGIIVAIALSIVVLAMFVAIVFAINRESGFYYEYKNKPIDDDKEIVEEIDSFEWIDEYPDDDDFFDYFYDDYDSSWDNN